MLNKRMVFTGGVLVTVLVSILIGAILQRLSGAGMGMVLAPMLTLTVGAANGVMLANSTTIVSAALMGFTLRRYIEWRKVAFICVAVAPGSFLGALVVRATPAAWLQIIVGVCVLGALAFTYFAGRLGKLPHVKAQWPAAVAGAAGAFLNTICGVSAPALVIHARLTHWAQREFAASLQPIFFTMGGMSIVMKARLGSTGVSSLPPWWLTALVIGTILIGIRVGTVLAPKVGQEQAKSMTFGLAAAGAAGVLIRGVVAL